MGSALSVSAKTNLGDHLSLGSDVLYFGKYQANTYVKTQASDNLQIYVGGTQVISFDNSGGTLHGTWDLDGGGSVTSDRRLKTKIMPLQRTLHGMKAESQVPSQALAPSVATGSFAQATTESVRPPTLRTSAASEDGVQWMLRQLRPVSYSFKTGADSKNMRFGFIADELESAVPQLVRSSTTRKQNGLVDEQKQIALQDLVALLTAAAQNTQATTEKLMDQVSEQQKVVSEQQKVIQEMRAELDQLQKLFQENTTQNQNFTKTKKKTTKNSKLILLRKRRSKVERQSG